MSDDDDRKPVMESWVCQIPGRVSFAIEDLRTGRVRTVTVKGKGQVLRLTDIDREIGEEKIRHEANNPFKNGMLVQRDAKKSSPQSMTDDELAGLFELDMEDFTATMASLSEVNVRRLKDLAKERNASYNHVGAIDDYIEVTYPIGGDTPTYREIMADRTAAER